MFRRIFQRPVSAIMILNGIKWNCLKSTPTKRYNDRVSILQDFVIPAMLFESRLYKYKNFFPSQQMYTKT